MALAPAALAALVALSLSVAPPTLPKADAASASTPVAPPFWAGMPDSGGFRALTEGELRTAREALDRLLAVKGPHTIENTLAPYNEALLHADNASYQAGLIESVHPDSLVRTVAEGVQRLHDEQGLGALIITHYQRILHLVKPDFVHVMFEGRIVKQGGPELVATLEERGYGWIREEVEAAA
jgi:hypothetical protein